MKIAYVTTYDARDLRAWSGLGYFIAQALENARLDVDYIGPIPVPRAASISLKRALYKYVRPKDYLWPRAPRIARRYADEVNRRLTSRRYDIVFSPDTIPVAYLQTDLPIVTWTDATFASMLDFYPGFATGTLAPESVADGMELEAAAVARARLSLYASDWAAASAIEDFGASPEQVHVVPFGANIAQPPDERQTAEAVRRRSTDSCELLFIGVEWERKGGDVALQVAQTLNASGLPTRLTIVGVTPRIPPDLLPNVEVHGYVDKTHEGAATIASLLARSHFLLHPTRAECYGLVLCEANGYAVPALTTAVGGVPTIMRNGLNGMMFEAGAGAEAYTRFILELFEDYRQYLDLARTSYAEYATRLNWGAAGATVRELLLTI